jgi:hypothetical protein
LHVSISPPPEYALLLDAIAPAQDAPSELRGWDAASWDRVVRLAEWHRLSPLLYRHLSDRRAAPAHVVDALEQRYFSNAARNLFIGAALSRVLEALAGAGVPAMPLKGAALVNAVYPDPGLRDSDRRSQRRLADAALAHRQDDAVAGPVEPIDKVGELGQREDVGSRPVPGRGGSRTGQPPQRGNPGHVTGDQVHARRAQA